LRHYNLDIVLKKIARLKIFYQRSAVYLSVINFGMLFTTLVKLFGLPLWTVVIAVPSGIGLMLFIGWSDYKFILEEEQKQLYDKVPQIRDLKK
jgi:hypothetical protein